MSVAVIIPFYKGMEWLKEAIKSVKNQTYKDWKIYLVNDGSEEDISEIYSYLPSDKLIIINQENAGAAVARNTAIDLCTEDFIAFLDADDLWDENKLKLQTDFLSNSGFNWVHCKYVRVNFNNTKVFNTTVSVLQGDVFIKSLLSCTIATPTVVIRSEILKDSSLRFVPHLRAGEDTIFWLRLLRKHPIGLVNKSLVSVRMHGKNAALNIKAQIEGRNAIYLYLETLEDNSRMFLFIKIIYSYFHWIHKQDFGPLVNKLFFLPGWMICKLLYKII